MVNTLRDRDIGYVSDKENPEKKETKLQERILFVPVCSCIGG